MYPRSLTHIYIYIYVYSYHVQTGKNIYIYIYMYMYISVTAKIHVYVYVYIGTVPYMPNINNIWTNIGHRSGHQSGLHENEGRNSITFLYGSAVRVYLVFYKKMKSTQY